MSNICVIIIHVVTFPVHYSFTQAVLTEKWWLVNYKFLGGMLYQKKNKAIISKNLHENLFEYAIFEMILRSSYQETNLQ